MNPKQRRRFLTLMGAILLVTAALVLPGSAVAQDQLGNPSAAQYEPQGDVLGGTASGNSGSPSVSGTPTGGNGNSAGPGSLPFTGMDLAIVAGVALLLTGTGLALHRLSVPPRS
jgi:hypothetical protein